MVVVRAGSGGSNSAGGRLSTPIVGSRVHGELLPTLTQVLEAGSWQERETHLSPAYEFVARMHNALGITEPLPAQVSQFHNRPFLVIHGERFADAIRAVITNEKVLELPENLGGVDQFIDSTDVLSQPGRCGQLRLMYQQGE